MIGFHLVDAAPIDRPPACPEVELGRASNPRGVDAGGPEAHLSGRAGRPPTGEAPKGRRAPGRHSSRPVPRGLCRGRAPRRASRGTTAAGDWWTARGSNPRPPDCEPGALPAELAAPRAATGSLSQQGTSSQRMAAPSRRRRSCATGRGSSPRGSPRARSPRPSASVPRRGVMRPFGVGDVGD